MKKAITFRSVVAFCAMTLMMLFHTGTANAQTQTPTAYAFLCLDTKTFYLTYTTDELKKGDTYDGGTIRYLWKGDDVLNSGANTPKWYSNASGNTKKVVIDASFSAARPTSTCKWFYNFTYLQSIVGIEYLNTSEVTNMKQMFRNLTNLTSLDVSHFDTSNVTDMSWMFSRCSKVPSLDVSHFDTSKVTNMKSMFALCHLVPSLDVSNFNTSNVTDMSDMFGTDNLAGGGCSSLTTLDLSNFDTSKVTTMKSMFRGCHNLTSLNLSGWDTSNVTTMEQMFHGCISLPQLDIRHFDTSKVTTMAHMFLSCFELPTIDLSGFNTTNVTDMKYMFMSCKKLESLDLSSFDTSNVTTMRSMFSACANLSSVDVSSFDTSNVTDMIHMFNGCTSLASIDVSNFDTSNVTRMANMFAACSSSSLTTLDLSNFDTSNVTDIAGMFHGCSSLKVLNIKDFDVSAVTSFSRNTREKGADKIGTLSYETNNVDPNNVFYPFSYCTAPTIICDQDWSTNTTATASDLLFTKDFKVVGEYGATYNSSNVDVSYAYSNPTGYFTKSEETLTANAADGFYWATYYNERVGSIADENTTVYKAVLDQENKLMNLEEIPDKIVKKGQAVILKSTSPTITLTRKTEVINGGAGNFSGNSLVGFDHNVTINSYDQPTDMGTLYTLGKVDGVLGFYKIKNGIQLKARKAYLAIPNGNEAGYRFDFNGDAATAIDNIISDESSESMNDVIYNLSGQRVDNPTRGVYIVNGKKVMIK